MNLESNKMMSNFVTQWMIELIKNLINAWIPNLMNNRTFNEWVNTEFYKIMLNS